MKTIKCHVRVEGGKLLTAANAHRIKAVALYPTDRMGNALHLDKKNGTALSPIYELRNDPPYFQEWRLVKVAKRGYAWREVTHGSGICGHRESVRLLVMATSVHGLFGTRDNIIIQVDDPKPGERTFAQWAEHFYAMDQRQHARWAQYAPLTERKAA